MDGCGGRWGMLSTAHSSMLWAMLGKRGLPTGQVRENSESAASFGSAADIEFTDRILDNSIGVSHTLMLSQTFKPR